MIHDSYINKRIIERQIMFVLRGKCHKSKYSAEKLFYPKNSRGNHLKLWKGFEAVQIVPKYYNDVFLRLIVILRTDMCPGISYKAACICFILIQNHTYDTLIPYLSTP